MYKGHPDTDSNHLHNQKKVPTMATKLESHSSLYLRRMPAENIHLFFTQQGRSCQVVA